MRRRGRVSFELLLPLEEAISHRRGCVCLLLCCPPSCCCCCCCCC